MTPILMLEVPYKAIKSSELIPKDQERTQKDNKYLTLMSKRQTLQTWVIYFINKSWITWHYRNPKRGCLESQWKVHEGNEKEKIRYEDKSNRSHGKGSKRKGKTQGLGQEIGMNKQR